VVGRAEPVEDRQEAAALRADPRWPRIIDDSETVMRLRPGLTSGRRLGLEKQNGARQEAEG
jgi:hypothetical protein